MRKPYTYWDEGITLVSSCTKCSPGCDNCWALAMEQRFKPEFKNQVECHPDRLSRFNTRKPKVFAIWNDLFHEDVPITFINDVFLNAWPFKHNTYLVLTKRAERLRDILITGKLNNFVLDNFRYWDNLYFGLTVCNQQEADEKIPIFLQVPGKKFLSIEPMLEEILLPLWICKICGEHCDNETHELTKADIDAVILGCETGAKARPMKLEWASKIADQCKAAGVPHLFIKALTINGKPNHNINEFPAELRIRELAW